MLTQKSVFRFWFLTTLIFGSPLTFFVRPNLIVCNESILFSPKFSSGEISIITPENKLYTEPMSGYYPATIGFENETIGDSPHGWTEFSELDRTTSIVAAYNGHKNVFKIYDNTFSASLTTVNRFRPKTHGTIEYWLLTSDVTRACSNILYDGPDWGLIFTIRDGYFKYRHLSTYHTISGAPIPQNNQWYHIRIEFRCNGAPAYKNLVEGRFFVYIDGTKYGDFPFVNPTYQINGFAISLGFDSALTSYLDAVGYSWNPNYNVGDNIHEGLLLSYIKTGILNWTGYSLDNLADITIYGNTTIPMPPNGIHNIQIFGINPNNHIYSSELKSFETDLEEPYISPNNGDNRFFIINLYIIMGIFIGIAVIIFTIIMKNRNLAKVKTEIIIPSSKSIEKKGDSKKQKKESSIERITLVHCPFCQMEIYSNQNFCNYCGGDIRGLFD